MGYIQRRDLIDTSLEKLCALGGRARSQRLMRCPETRPERRLVHVPENIHKLTLS